MQIELFEGTQGKFAVEVGCAHHMRREDVWMRGVAPFLRGKQFLSSERLVAEYQAAAIGTRGAKTVLRKASRVRTTKTGKMSWKVSFHKHQPLLTVSPLSRGDRGDRAHRRAYRRAVEVHWDSKLALIGTL